MKMHVYCIHQVGKVNTNWFCQNSSALKDKTLVVRETLPDVHIHNVAVGPDPEMDKANTVFMRCVDQVRKFIKIRSESS